jgi:hypothetical protein
MVAAPMFIGLCPVRQVAQRALQAVRLAGLGRHRLPRRNTAHWTVQAPRSDQFTLEFVATGEI